MDNGMMAGLFVIGTLLLTAISWRSLRNTAHHGFTRWLAWIGILAIIILNADVWFVERYSPPQILSWLLLTLSILSVALGVLQLKLQGRAQAGQRDDAALYAFERTTVLVDNGIYALIRHPMYLSLILLAWGAAVKDATWLTLGLALFVTACLYLTSRRDEKECLMFFGDAYVAYMQRSKRFIPWLW